MQALIHQASLCRLQLPVRGASVVPGQRIELELVPDDAVAAVITLPSRLPFGLGKPRRKHLGYLNPEAAEMLAPALGRKAPLRVRIVEVEPAHVRIDGVDQVSISVWGEPGDMAP